MKKKKQKKLNISQKIEKYLLQNEKLLEKEGLSMQLVVNFPKRTKVPMLGKLALWIIRKKGGILDIRFKEDVAEK